MSTSTTLQDLQDDVDLFEGLLQSVNDMSDMQEEKQYYTTKLAELKAQIERMGTIWSNQSDQPNLPRPTSATSLTPDDTQISSTNWQLTLPNRKRDRNDDDDDPNISQMPRTKSRRSTPADSPTLSAVDSVDSNYFENLDSDLLGNSWRDDLLRSDREARRQREIQRRQELEDEEFARRLQQEYNDRETSAQSSRPTQLAPSQHNQSTLRPNGAFTRPPVERDRPPIKHEILGDHTNTTNTISSDDDEDDCEDDDLAMLRPDQWASRFPASTGSARILPQSFQQPQTPNLFGSGSAMQSAYTSFPGSAVYGSSSQPVLPASNGGFLSRLQAFNPLPALASLGSQSNPFDLERLTRMPFSYFGDPNTSFSPQGWAPVDPKETQEEIRQLLHNIRPDEEIDPSEAGDLQPEELKVRLMPHQVKGLAWMKKMEEGSNRGGILADDMGLGKTVQAIALMLSRPPPDGIRRPTLVVTPVALMEQWKREISKMVRANSKMSVAILHGSKSHTAWATIKHYDVVLTSYGTLGFELKRKLDWEEKLKINPDIRKVKANECPILDDKSRFHRIFLDEAQNIKNKGTRAAMAACRVNADYRWCLSGTPMQNNVDEMFSLIKFLRIRPYHDYDKFSKDISRPLKNRYEQGQKRAMERLQTVLKAILLRRTKKSMVDGQPILQLPEKHTVESRAVFGKDQLEFYKALEMQTQIQFNKFVKNGTVGRNYSKALVLLLRLRQCCCSPQLVTNSADFVTDSGVEGTDLVANAKSLQPDVVARLKEQEDIECPICMDAVENPIIFNCGHALCHDCFSRMVDTVSADTADNVKCPHCRAKIDTRKITDFSSFKEVYMDGPRAGLDDEDDSSGDDEDLDDPDSDSESVESDGSDDGQDLKDFIVNDNLEIEAAEESSEDEDDLDRIKKPKKPAQLLKGDPHKKEKAKKKSKGKKKEKVPHKSLADLRKEGLKSRAAKKKYLRQLGKIYEPCAKIDKTLELLHGINQEDPTQKTIVFSSFTSFLDLVEVPLTQHEDHSLRNYTRYDGSMTAKDRNDAVLRFTDDFHCKVMLVSLKAGNAGLNLTIANHVIILDPFWNPFVEYQAADRCYRIGQRREVTVHRVLIGEEGIDHDANPGHIFTVEDRILQLQEKKRTLVENALDENAAGSVSRLGMRELGYLFGVNDMPANARS